MQERKALDVEGALEVETVRGRETLGLLEVHLGSGELATTDAELRTVAVHADDPRPVAGLPQGREGQAVVRLGVVEPFEILEDRGPLGERPRMCNAR